MAATTSSESPKQVNGSCGKASVHENGSNSNAAAEGSSPSSSPSTTGPTVVHQDNYKQQQDPASPTTPTTTTTSNSGDGTVGIPAEKKAGEENAVVSSLPSEMMSAVAAAAPRAVPTYDSVAGSDLYLTALALMKEGEFEDCINLLEQGMDELKEELKSWSSFVVGPVDVHPSMAPYYYLYGSTLLYKVEEQDLNGPDGGASAGVVVTDGAVAMGEGGVGDKEPEGQDDEEYEDDAAEAGGAAAGDEFEGAADQDPDSGGDKVEDMQVAWEFLEAARGVLENIVASDEPGPDADEHRADLAQVRKRAGDLNRMNDQNQDAAADYQAALDYLKDNARVGPYDRKIADLHYNLGLVYMLDAAEAAAAAASSDAEAATTGKHDPVVAALLPGLMASSPPPTKVLSGRERAELRSRGVYHYWQCCKVLAGHLATLCGVQDPSEVLERAERSVANLKSTSDTAVGEAAHPTSAGDLAEHPAIVSRKLSKLRADLALHVPSRSEANGDEGKQELVDLAAELLQLLEEIQETIDEAERSEEGVQQVTEMKAEITAAAAAAGQAGGETGHGFGSAAAAASSAAAQPILAVKKKAKKRGTSEADLKDPVDGSKRPAAE